MFKSEVFSDVYATLKKYIIFFIDKYLYKYVIYTVSLSKFSNNILALRS